MKEVIIDLRFANRVQEAELELFLHKNEFVWSSGGPLDRGRLLDESSDAVRLYYHDRNDRREVRRGSVGFYQHDRTFKDIPVVSLEKSKYLFNKK